MHLKKCAIDLNFFKSGNGELVQDKDSLQEIGNYWESLSKFNRWGGNFKSFIDTPHFERYV
jgi:peptidoglycan L-alanyl-D-glutamate endopeptidase CwlK